MPITDGNGSTIEPAGGWRILANSTARKTINLDAAPESVRKISIEDTIGDAGTSNVTINASGSQTIDGSSSIVLDANYQRKVLESTGTGWTVVASAVAGVNTTDSGDLTVDSLSIRDAFSFPTSDGTNGQVLKTDGNGALTWQNDNTGSGGGSVSASDLTSSVVSYSELYDPDYDSSTQKAVSNTRRFHINIDTHTVNTWHDLISWRPYMSSNPGVEPGSSTYWGAMAYRVKIGGHQGGAGGGNGMNEGHGGVQYVGHNAYYASDMSTDTFGTAPSLRIVTSGWISTLQFNPTGGNFVGFAYVDLHFGRGAGPQGQGLYWDITIL